jgi:signal transduction histidine kinase
MRLFTKTYLFFIVVILFQSAFTIVLVTESVGHANIEDARRELLFEAKKVSSDFSEAERSLWKDLAGMMNDEDLKKADISSISAVEIIRSSYNTSGARFVELYDVSGIPEVLSMEGTRPVPSVSFSSLPFYDFPSIRRVLADGRLYLVGSVRYKKGHAFRLIIDIDYTFVRQLAYGQNTQVLLFAGQRYIIGTLGEMLPKDFNYALLFDAAEAEYYNLRIDKEFANISVRQEGFLFDGLLSVPLQFVVSVSNVPYDKRLGSIRSALLVVSLLMAFVAMIIAYFFSRNISSPVGNFIAAMNKLSAGEYEGVDENLYKSELKQLACGFNDMSMKLKENHRELERSIEEITMLKDYNEAVIQSIRSGIAIIDPLLRVEKVNHSFLDFFGVGEDVLLNFPVNLLPSEIIDSEHVKDITDILNGKKRYASRTQKIAGNRYIEYKLFPLIRMGGKDSGIYGCIILLEDVSGKVDYEAKIFQAEKLASVSMLSAGVAHEINNPLASILSNIQNLEEDASEGYQKDTLLLVEKETRRIARIVRRLLDFAAPAAEGESSPISLGRSKKPLIF